MKVESFKIIDQKINKNLEIQKDNTNNISINIKNNEEINDKKANILYVSINNNILKIKKDIKEKTNITNYKPNL